MTDFWIFIWIFGTMYPVQRGRLWVRAQSPTESPVYQPDKELSVDIGESATLRCCVLDKTVGIVIWFKQPERKKPQTLVTVYKKSEGMLYTESKHIRFQIETYGKCFNTTILKTVPSDEAMYYCARKSPSTVFGDGTYLKIKGTSKPALCDNSVVCEPTVDGNRANMNTQEKTVLGLGTALGVCALLIFFLTYFILRRKCDKMNASGEDSPGMSQEPDAETLHYAGLQFTKRKVKAEKRKIAFSEDCVYSDVK